MCVSTGITVVLVVSLWLLTSSASAVMVDTVNWAPDFALDGTGSGTLNGGALTVTYSTVVGIGNAAVTISDNWNDSLATDNAVGMGVTHETGGVFGVFGGGAGGAQLLTIAFSAPVTNPILYVNFSDATTTMDFGALALALLDSNNASLTGSVVTFAGSTNGFNDGFAAQIASTFGPGNPLQFTYTTTLINDFDSVGFTVAGTTVPEPSTVALFVTGLGALGVLAYRRRRA